MVAPKREVALITNPAAGKGRSARARDLVVNRLRSRGMRVTSLEGRDAATATDLARAAVAGGVDALVVCGGDGMVNVGLQAVAATGTPLGIVPAGTGNDTARYLGIPRDDPAAAADVVARGSIRILDLALTNGRYYSTVLAAGFDALVNERANQMRWPRGQMRYHLATLAELRTFAPRPYTLDLDGRVVRTEAMLVAVGNGPSFGGGLRITEGARLDDGMLDVVMIAPMRRSELVRFYPRLFDGSHTSLPQYQHHRARRVTVAAPGIVAYADGERFGPLPTTIETAPGALAVLAPGGAA